MCISPLILEDGTQTACHNCWQCIERKVDDWVGRNIAESKTAMRSFAITLTYGRNRVGDVDHERAVILTYSDVQKYFKLLRRHGYPMRYLVTGEYGSAKGRAHWHVMIWWLDRVPEHVLDKRFDEAHWPHGVSFWTRPSFQAIRYNLKYIQKDIGEAERQGHLAMSKKPPIGSAYFERLAEQYVKQGLAPQDLVYTFPEAKMRSPLSPRRGELLRFMLGGRSAELFMEHYVRTWAKVYPGAQLPNSELVENWVEWGVTRVPEDLAKFHEFATRRLGRHAGGAGARGRKPVVYTPEEMAELVRQNLRRVRSRDAFYDMLEDERRIAWEDEDWARAVKEDQERRERDGKK